NLNTAAARSHSRPESWNALNRQRCGSLLSRSKLGPVIRCAACVVFFSALACTPLHSPGAPKPAPQVDSEVNMSELRHDVCGFDQPVSGGTVDSDGLVNIVANHPHLLYMGRIDCSTPLAPA